jgi:hypothetical protein
MPGSVLVQRVLRLVEVLVDVTARMAEVAQIANLLCRRLAVGEASGGSDGSRMAHPRYGRLPVCATAQQVGRTFMDFQRRMASKMPLAALNVGAT